MTNLSIWQAAFFAEPPSRLTSRHPAPIRDEDDVTIEGTQVGVDFSKALLDYLSGSRGHFPVHDALLLWERECRRRHRSWWDHPDGRPTCANLAWAVIGYRTSVAWAADFYGVPFTRAERHLLSAIRWMRARQEKWLADTAVSAGHDPEYCRVCRGEAA
jgi:hypothetical protein